MSEGSNTTTDTLEELGVHGAISGSPGYRIKTGNTGAVYCGISVSPLVRTQHLLALCLPWLKGNLGRGVGF